MADQKVRIRLTWTDVSRDRIQIQAHTQSATGSLLDNASTKLMEQLINSKEYSSSWEANSCWAGQEIPRPIWSSNVLYRIHKSPPHVLILSQMNPVHIPHILSKIHFNTTPSHWRLGISSSLLLRHFPANTRNPGGLRVEHFRSLSTECA
jgi:hypothetical protein